MSEAWKILLEGIPGRSSRGWLGYCTCVLFRLDDTWALFDTGHYADRHLLLERLDAEGVRPSDIKAVVLSHLHFDHVLNLSLFENAQVYVARRELDYASRVTAGKAVDLSIPDIWPALLKGRHVCEVDGSLELSATVKLVCLPGHTPGSLAMFLGGEVVTAVCGDVIKNAWEAVSGRTRMALAGDASASRSISRIMQSATVIVPGHDRPFRQRKEGLEFLTTFDWDVQATLYPAAEDRTILSIHLPA